MSIRKFGWKTEKGKWRALLRLKPGWKIRSGGHGEAGRGGEARQSGVCGPSLLAMDHARKRSSQALALQRAPSSRLVAGLDDPFVTPFSGWSLLCTTAGAVFLLLLGTTRPIGQLRHSVAFPPSQNATPRSCAASFEQNHLSSKTAKETSWALRRGVRKGSWFFFCLKRDVHTCHPQVIYRPACSSHSQHADWNVEVLHSTKGLTPRR